jgi:hypothetical protein
MATAALPPAAPDAAVRGPRGAAPAVGRRAARLGALLAAALLLTWPALWNGYPPVFADTGTYLGQALDRYLGWDRPPFYSLFLLSTHWGLSLWAPVLAQGLILAHLLSLALRVQGLAGPLPLLAAAAALGAVTGLPWFAAQLMPDLFTGVVVLALWLLGFRAAGLTRAERIWMLLLAAGAVAVHQSHLPLALGLVLVGAALLWAGRGWRAMAPAALRMLAPPLLAALAMVAVNLAGHGRPSVSPFGSVFLATRLIYDGPGLAVLRRDCPGAGWRICAVVLGRGLPGWHNAFLWDPDGPLHRELGGAKAWAPEAGAIIRATVLDAPGAVAAAALENTLRQLVMLDTGDGLEAWPGVPGPEPLIARHFPEELEAFRASRQQAGLLRPDAERLAPLYRAAALAGFAALVLMLATGRGRRAIGLPGAALAAFVLVAALGNAAVTGGLSGPVHRYQARLAWLFVLAPALLAAPPLLVRRSSGPAPAPGAAPAA